MMLGRVSRTLSFLDFPRSDSFGQWCLALWVSLLLLCTRLERPRPQTILGAFLRGNGAPNRTSCSPC